MTDTRRITPLPSGGWGGIIRDNEDRMKFTDETEITNRISPPPLPRWDLNTTGSPSFGFGGRIVSSISPGGGGSISSTPLRSNNFPLYKHQVNKVAE